MFATVRSFIPEPRQADQPRKYVGRHRVPEATPQRDGGVAVAVHPDRTTDGEPDGPHAA